MSEQRTWPRRLGLAAVGLVIGLGAAEAAFHARDQGAFPHLNVYTPDATLGVRLRPGATQRVAFGGNPVTEVRINSLGLRGAEPPAPGGDEIVVVGDSQVFGLGVQENETFAARLEGAMGGATRVLNAGVPTYGPPEYERLIDELMSKRSPKTVVYTINMVNDLFEARRPNTERHAVWDGWAVRKENAPAETASFPGRERLYRDSHAFFALRRLLFTGGQGADADAQRAVPSEGNTRDLIDLAGALEAERARARDETARQVQKLESETRYAELAEVNADLLVKKLAYDNVKGGGEMGVYLASRASPGDIVIPQRGEELGPLAASVRYIREAAELRRTIEARLREQAERTRDSEASREILQALSDREATEARLRAIHAAPVRLARASLPIVPVLERARKIVEARGGRMVLLVLPIDVQVSKDEWRKYGTSVEDTGPTRILVDDLIESARQAGVTAVDPWKALEAASPGAFLKADPHLSPKGHEAVARELAAALKSPPPTPAASGLALAEGRSRLPHPREWASRSELAVTGSTAANCATKRIREWLYVRCNPTAKLQPRAVRVLSGGHGEVLTVAADVVTLVAPVVQGDTFEARFSWADHARRLRIPWPKGEVEPEAAFVKDEAPPEPAPPAPEAEAALCACAAKTPSSSGLTGEQIDLRTGWDGKGDQTLSEKPAACGKLLAFRDADCVATFAGDCEKMLECAAGIPRRMPACPPGKANKGAALRCADAAPQAHEITLLVGEKPPARPDDAAVDAVARPFLDAALAAADACHLEVEDAGSGNWFDYQLYDECAWKAEMIQAVTKAASSLDAWIKTQGALPLPLSVFTDQASLFASWLERSHRTRRSRGTLMLYQQLAQSWNAYHPKAAVPLDPPTARQNYYEKVPNNDHADYIFRSYGTYQNRKKNLPNLPWRTTGAYGPSVP